MLSTVGGARAGVSSLFHCVWPENNCWECQDITVSIPGPDVHQIAPSDRLIMHVHMKEFHKRNDFKHAIPLLTASPSKSKSLWSASIFLKSCMVEHLKWARTSPPGTDSDLIGARQAASAYLYNYVIWRLSKGSKDSEKRLQKRDYRVRIAWATFH